MTLAICTLIALTSAGNKIIDTGSTRIVSRATSGQVIVYRCPDYTQPPNSYISKARPLREFKPLTGDKRP